jgi:hypothetical protein
LQPKNHQQRFNAAKPDLNRCYNKPRFCLPDKLFKVNKTLIGQVSRKTEGWHRRKVAVAPGFLEETLNRPSRKKRVENLFR